MKNEIQGLCQGTLVWNVKNVERIPSTVSEFTTLEKF